MGLTKASTDTSVKEEDYRSTTDSKALNESVNTPVNKPEEKDNAEASNK